MSDFQNTIDLLGDEAVINAILNGSIVEFNDDKISKISVYRFLEMTSLETINIPFVTSVGQHAFKGCTKLSSVNMQLFTHTTNNGRDIFYNCKSLTSVDFPLLTGSLQYTFYNCSALISAKIPSVTTLGGSTFWSCSSLTDVDLSNVSTVGSASFWNCTSIASLDFPKVTSIANQVFQGCTLLKTLALRSTTLCTLSDSNAFNNTPFYSGNDGGTLLVPRSLVEEYKTATNWSVIWGYGHNRFLALEDYTVDGTITGEIDWDKLGGTT